MATQHRTGGTGAHQRFAGADATALSLQQHEYDSVADAQRPGPRRGGRRRSVRSVAGESRHIDKPVYAQLEPFVLVELGCNLLGEQLALLEPGRLDDRLAVRWELDGLPMQTQMPSLTIQPLLENAIYHGIELLPEGGEVVISGSQTDSHLTISISNPVASGEKRATGGNQMAMANIQQRFELAYGSEGSVDIDDTADQFTVTLRFPLDEGGE